MDRIKIIILIFALSFCTTNSYACYDDDDDDWSQYDEYDYDDCDDEDEDDDDDDPNAFYYNDGSILMDEVVVTAPAPRSDEEDDDDWWRRYESYDNDDDWYGYDDGDGAVAIGYGDGDQNIDKSDANIKQYLVQTCQYCCVPTVLAIINMYINNLSIEDAEKLQLKYREIFQEWKKRDISVNGINSNEIRIFLNKCGFVNRTAFTPNAIYQCTSDGKPVFAFIMVSENGEEHGHSLAIISTNINEMGDVVSFECINPATGYVETHMLDEFNGHWQSIFGIIKINQ